MKEYRKMAAVMLASFCLACSEPASPVTETPAPETPAAEVTPSPSAVPEETVSVEAGIAAISKYGNIILTVQPETMMELGFEPGDLVRVTIGETSIEMPVGTEYSDVESGEPVCTFKYSSSAQEEQVVLAVNAGNMTGAFGIAEKEKIQEDPGYVWNWNEGFDENVSVFVEMSEKQGYAEEYLMHQVAAKRTDNREDYPDLSDEEYANFRAVSTTGMGKETLFRSSSPVNPTISRNHEADNALLNAGVRTVMNMADSEQAMKAFEDYLNTSYSHCDVIALDMEMDFFAETFTQKLADGYRWLASHEGPYLIHCKEGKDRTGFSVGILECLMGASADEIVEDYMKTYENFYGVEHGSQQYDQIASGNIEKSLARAFGIESIHDADLQKCAEAYLKQIGLSDDEINALKENLSKDYGGQGN